MKKGILYALVCCGVSVGFVGWRLHALRNQAAPHFEIVADFSLSHAQGCESLLGLAEQALRTEGVSASSTLTVLILGDGATANEPWQLGRYSIPVTRKVLEGRTANLRRQQDILHDISNKCRTIRRTAVSPIYLGVTRAVADLRAHGCKGTSHCQLFVDSDLEENAEGSIRSHLNSTRYVQANLPSLIENEGLHVVFCGLAVTAGQMVDPSDGEIRKVSPRDSRRDDRLRHTWASLFLRPELVMFEPYCPQKKR